MSTRAHVLLVVGWGALALVLLFGGLALELELPGWMMAVLMASVTPIPAYLARSPLTPKPVPEAEKSTVRLSTGLAASESGELPAAESNEALK